MQHNNESLFTSAGFTPNCSFAKKIAETLDKSAIISVADNKGIITYVNKNFCKLMGYTHEELIGRSHNIIKHPKTKKETIENLWNTILSGKSWNGTISNLHKDGSLVRTSSTISPIVNSDNLQIEHFISIRIDETSDFLKEEKIKLNRITDTQTNLCNKEKLSIDIGKIHNQSLLCFLDISKFSQIHTYYGKTISEKILNEYANGLRKQFKDFRIYRLYADVFAILSLNTNITTTAFERKVRTSINILSKKPIKVDDIEVYLQVNCGIAKSTERLYEKAEIALKCAKQKREEIVIYNPSQEDNTIDLFKNKENTVELISALEENRIVAYFQPIINNKTKEIEKYECLSRLIKNDGSLLRPDIFIETAQKISKYEEITRIMVKKTFDFFTNKPYHFSLNISSADIANPKTKDYIYRQLARFPETQRVVFEILEDKDFAKEMKLVREFIDYVHEKGCTVAIDDFGTGYSNFTALVDLDIDFLKIDGSIIQKIHEPKYQNIIRSIVQAAKELDLKTIAEFVSDDATYQKVIELDIDYSQGYEIGKPSHELVK